MPAALLMALSTAALAQDDGGMELIDIDFGEEEIEIGGPEPISYTGGLTEKAPDYAAGKPVTITHSGGNVSVRCQESEGISAQINYVLEGHDGPALEGMGRGIGLRAWGDSNGGGVQSQVPWKPASVTDAQVPLVVTLPRQAQVTVNNRGGWIEVINCEGTVTASTDQGGVYASGVYSSFSLASGTGDVTLEAKDGSEVKATSRAVANTGAVKVKLPLTISATIAATGSDVTIYHTVDGTVTPTNVSGTIGTGGHQIRLQAQGPVSMSTP
jgi:hypothetical protein